MGSPTSQPDRALEFILSRDEPFQLLTPRQWVELLDKTLSEIGGQMEYLKAFGLSGIYRGAFEDMGMVDEEKRARHELRELNARQDGHVFFIGRNKKWGWVRLDPRSHPRVIADFKLDLDTTELLPFLEADNSWGGPKHARLGYKLYAGLMQLIEEGIAEAYKRAFALEENLKRTRQQGMRVRALYEPHPEVEKPYYAR
jgi:hypothetical protein